MPHSPCFTQTETEIGHHYYQAKVGDEVVIRETHGGFLRYYFSTIDRIQNGRIYPKGFHSFWAKSGRNCFHPKGQSHLVIPTDAIRAYAAENSADPELCFSARTEGDPEVAEAEGPAPNADQSVAEAAPRSMDEPKASDAPVEGRDPALVFRVENVVVGDNYSTSLKEYGRPPSRGGNTRAWHQHVVVIEGETYSWLGLGAKKWIYATDTVSFAWSWDKSGRYRNVDRDTIAVRDKAGNPVVRGERGAKTWRSAPNKLPAHIQRA